MMENRGTNRSILITIDTDWAPDFAIDAVAGELERRRVPATWFVTHRSPAIDRLRRLPDLFELGIHPNFLPGSSHGDAPDAVLDHCLSLVPHPISMRSHALVQSTPILAEALERTTLRADVSLFLPHLEVMAPVEHWWRGKRLWRIPYVWEDDFEMERPAAQWSCRGFLDGRRGLIVFDFHPIHVFLNSRDPEAYEELKRRAPRLVEAKEIDTSDLVASGAGTGSFFRELVERMESERMSCRVRDLVERWEGES